MYMYVYIYIYTYILYRSDTRAFLLVLSCYIVFIRHTFTLCVYHVCIFFNPLFLHFTFSSSSFSSLSSFFHFYLKFSFFLLSACCRRSTFLCALNSIQRVPASYFARFVFCFFFLLNFFNYSIGFEIDVNLI